MRQSLASVPQFLRYLSTFPPADLVMEALIRGPLAHVHARSGMLWQVHGDEELVVVGEYGQTPEEVARYAVLPMPLPIGIVDACLQRRVLVHGAEEFARAYIEGIDAELWMEIMESRSCVASVSVPLVHGERLVGGLGFLVGQEWDEQGDGPRIVSGLAGVLALWLTHPRAGLDGPRSISRQWSLAFTPRQRQALLLVESGMSNYGIAVQLHVSESSVKADLAQAMRALRTSDRREAAIRARALGLLPSPPPRHEGLS